MDVFSVIYMVVVGDTLRTAELDGIFEHEEYAWEYIENEIQSICKQLERRQDIRKNILITRYCARIEYGIGLKQVTITYKIEPRIVRDDFKYWPELDW